MRGPLQGKAAGGRYPSDTPALFPRVSTPGAARAPAQTRYAHYTCGADSHLLTVFLRYPNLYVYLELPGSFSALFKRRNIVLLEN